jgi:hypothetical protein
MALDILGTKGAWVTVSCRAGSPVKGWLIGEILQGLLIALDENLQDVRLVSEYGSIAYDYKKVLPKLRYKNA